MYKAEYLQWKGHEAVNMCSCELRLYLICIPCIHVDTNIHMYMLKAERPYLSYDSPITVRLHYSCVYPYLRTEHTQVCVHAFMYASRKKPLMEEQMR